MPIGDKSDESGPHIEKMFDVSSVTMELVYEQDWKIDSNEAAPVRINAELRNLDRVVLSASGRIWAGVLFTGENGPKGWNNIDSDPTFPLVGSHPYCLIGRTNGKWFYIGDGVDYYCRHNASTLDLWINDDVHGGGSGAFDCHVQVWRRVA